MKEWTWENIVALGSLLHSSKLTVVTENNWDTAHEDLEFVNFISTSIDAHCSEEARAEYVKAGLCEGICNTDYCPKYFLNNYLYVYHKAQLQSTHLDGVKPLIYCRCTVGNCVKCKCRTEKQLCSIYCHGGTQSNNPSCRNCQITRLNLRHQGKAMKRNLEREQKKKDQGTKSS
eukprot:scaffold10219_cov275-Chaetoceros_neogracile.AAC.2